MKLETFTLKAIAAMASNRIIGRDGALPWHLPEDLKWFKKCTMGSPILMGRKTFESFPKLLPGRRHLVLSRSLSEAPEGVDLLSTPADIASLEIEGDIYVIGGAGIYELLLPSCAELFLTCVQEAYEGDTLMPEFEKSFELVEVLETHEAFELRRYVNKDIREISDIGS